MFDGNYRSRQQQVNLGNRRSRRPNRNREAILEESKALRLARLKEKEKQNAALVIGKVARGVLARKQVALHLDHLLLQDCSLAGRTTALNLRLAYRLDDRVRYLEAYASVIREKLSADKLDSCPLAHRIVRTVLRHVRQNLEAEVAESILRYCFSMTGRNTSLQKVYWKQLGGVSGYITLLETILHLVTQEPNLPSSRQQLTQHLWSLALTSAPEAVTGTAALGAILLSREHVFRRDGATSDKDILGWNAKSFKGLVVPVVSVLMSTQSSDPLVSMVRRIESQNQNVVLSNILDLYAIEDATACDPSVLVRYLRRVLASRSDLAVVVGLMARGDDGVKILNTPLTSTASMSETMQTDDEDSDDEELHQWPTASKPPVTGRLSRQELSTMTRIDRNYHAQVERWCSGVLTSGSGINHAANLSLGAKMSDADKWLSWGSTILSSLQESQESRQTQEAYVMSLAIILQSSTGLRSRASSTSPFLTKLAFHATFLEKLWRYVLVQSTNSAATQITYTAFSVFSDVFAHRLIALKDDQFLVEHTTMQSPRVILAEHVIVRLRDLLYELYWSNPVRLSDVQVAYGRALSPEEQLLASRGRLLLTGTKLWQSLHERWCRLMRHAPFCDESTWLFPHMMMLPESSVVGVGGAQPEPQPMAVDSDDDGDEPMTGVDNENEELADAFSDPKMARILTSIPQALPFDRRVKLFHSLLMRDKQRTQDEASEMRQAMLLMLRGEETEMTARERVEIHRDRMYDDAMRQLNSLGPRLKRKVQVSFINQHGAREAGIDGGGVFKEFVDDLIKDAFSVDSGAGRKLFSVTPLQTLAVNTGLTCDLALLPHYEFLGRVLGKAVYESILVEPQFCLPFLNQLLGRTNGLEDLKNSDPEYYRNLLKLLTLSSEDVDGLGLFFEVTLGDGSSRRTVDLCRGGRSMRVSKENVIQYVHLVAHQRLNVESARQTKAFLQGFRDLIPAPWVRLFSAYELQKLISGDDSIRGIDVASLKATMQYAAGYHPSQPIIEWFWEILDEMTSDEQRKFLRFMTSCSRQPLLGFGTLDPAPCIQQIRLSDEVYVGDPIKMAPLPTSSTCMNLLKLPNYRNKNLMRIKLLAAIEAGAGFELT